MVDRAFIVASVFSRRHEALIAAADAPGYPTVFGPESLRQAAVDWIERRFDVTGLSPSQVLPTVGSKELIANLPTQLGLGAGDLIVVPELAYPTYEVGARYAGCEVVATDSTLSLGPRVPAIIFLNSPANPTGRILPPDHLRKVVDWARERGTLVVSDDGVGVVVLGNTGGLDGLGRVPDGLLETLQEGVQ